MNQIVLVVDDDVTSLKLATGILEKDYRVAAAISGNAAPLADLWVFIVGPFIGAALAACTYKALEK